MLNNLTIKNKYLFIPNTDGSPRWIWSINENKPHFLTFYPVNTLRQQIFVWGIKLIFLLRLQSLVFPVYKKRNEEGLNVSESVFTGTKGPNQKVVSYDKVRDVFNKKAVGEKASELIQNEARILSFLQASKENFSFDFPDLIDYSKEKISISALKNESTKSRLSNAHVRAIHELNKANSDSKNLTEWGQWIKITKRIDKLKNAKKVDKSIVYLLSQLAGSIDKNKTLEFGLAHGDFTPWNCFFDASKKLQVIDWEMACMQKPKAYDFFHYLFQSGILLKKKSWKKIYNDISTYAFSTNNAELLGLSPKNINQYLRLYLIDHISFYLEVYEKQEDWFDQIHWQMDTWKTALIWANCMDLCREKLIKSFFQRFHSHDYAVLKLGENNPAKIDHESDLDLLIHKKDFNEYLSFLKALYSTKNVKVVRKSFMAHVRIDLHNEESLHMDFIWQLKRKAKMFLDAKKMIQNGHLNKFDVKIVSEKDNAKYIQQFFVLNGKEIPKKYESLVNEYHSLNAGISQRKNRGLSQIWSFLTYVVDTLRTIIWDRGFIVTFSGVDGAGKSTIIEEIKQKIHQKYRKPVKILRHRPSILPIISSWKYGKEAAEKRSIKSLPRQGENTNALSSFLRFSYYFFDFLIGQFIIQFKYVLRGHIVIYDRYYYDFIHDAKRSNIQLNSRLIQGAGSLLMYPKYNFFLYADPAVILERKQELSEEVISELTTVYSNFFAKKDSKRKCFKCIENIEKKHTINQILDNINE